MVNVGTGTAGSAVLKTKYPVTEDLIAGTTTQEGRITNLVADETKVADKDREGI